MQKDMNVRYTSYLGISMLLCNYLRIQILHTDPVKRRIYGSSLSAKTRTNLPYVTTFSSSVKIKKSVSLYVFLDKLNNQRYVSLTRISWAVFYL